MDVEASPTRFAAEVATTRIMVERVHHSLGVTPARLAADKAYGSGPLLAWLLDRDIEPHIPVIDRTRQTDGRFARDMFTYDDEGNCFTCPAGKALRFCGSDHAVRAHRYRSLASDCASCTARPDYTTGKNADAEPLVRRRHARSHACPCENRCLRPLARPAPAHRTPVRSPETNNGDAAP